MEALFTINGRFIWSMASLGVEKARHGDHANCGIHVILQADNLFRNIIRHRKKIIIHVTRHII